MKQENKKNGITLISLIITVIVMMILVGVTVSLITSNDLTRVAERVGEEYSNQMATEGSLGEITINGKKYSSIQEYYNKISGEIPWFYEENEDGTITITGIDFSTYNATAGENQYGTADLEIDTLVFPEKINGKIVKKVNWKDLVIPLDNIDTNSNSNIEIKGVKKIVFSDTITSLIANGYEGNNKEENENDVNFANFRLVFPDAEEVILPKNLTTIGAYFFAGWGAQKTGEWIYNSNLELTIPASVYSIGEFAFNYVKTIYMKAGTFTEEEVEDAGEWGSSVVFDFSEYKVKVGDYIKYDPTNLVYGELSDLTYSGHKATNTINWRVLSIHSGYVEIISEEPVQIGTYGGYEVRDEALENMCKIYGWGSGRVLPSNKDSRRWFVLGGSLLCNFICPLAFSK